MGHPITREAGNVCEVLHSPKFLAQLKDEAHNCKEGGVSFACDCSFFVCTCIDSFFCSGCCAGHFVFPGHSVHSLQISGHWNQVPVLVLIKSILTLDYEFPSSLLSYASFPYGSDLFLGMPSMLQPLRGCPFSFLS